MKELQFQNQEIYGYTGRILRINLTEKKTEIVDSRRYVPAYLGGRSVCNRIFWDEVGAGVHAFDPENKIILMTGATCGTGMPASARITLAGISPNNYPEQFCHSNMGGFFGGMLKYAGYDGLIIEGKSKEHVYVLIQDEKTEILPADDFIWGELVHESQEKIYEKYGRNAHSLVIGPAGEHLHRNASVVNNNDNAAAKAGFGAVWGSKNLKAIVVMGTQEVRTANPRRVVELHKTVGYPPFAPNPLKRVYKSGAGSYAVDVPEGYRNARLCCGYGCNAICMNTNFDAIDPFKKNRTVAAVIKCTDGAGNKYKVDFGRPFMHNVYSEVQEKPRGEIYEKMEANPEVQLWEEHPVMKGSYQYNKTRINDLSDPALQDKEYTYLYKGTPLNLWNDNYERACALSILCAQYGLDKWDILHWYMPWFSAAKQMGLLDDLNLEIEVDTDSAEFVKEFMHRMAYREGKFGEIFGEGMARAIRHLGKEKYGDTLYTNAQKADTGEPYAFPVSMEAIWGHGTHYQGRGFQESPKYLWMCYSLLCMGDSRDMVCSAHLHDEYKNYVQYREDPAHSDVFAEVVRLDEVRSHLKDSLVTCEWKSPNPGWPNMEAEMFKAVTGIDATMDDLYDISFRSALVFRAVMMRNHGRCRKMEVEASFPIVSRPDTFGNFCTWDEWNDAVDRYYQHHGFDLATGWPFRSTWEKYGLSDIADEMEKLGMLPPESGTVGYVRAAEPDRKCNS